MGTISRRNFLDMHKKQVILVDHNEKDQAVDNIEKAEILEIIDHHKLGSLETMKPINFRNEPVGCTATILYRIYDEQRLEIPPKIAGLLCSHYFRYLNVPFPNLHPAGQDRSKCACTDRGH